MEAKSCRSVGVVLFVVLALAAALAAQAPLPLREVADALATAAERPAADRLDGERVAWARQVLAGTSRAERDAVLAAGGVPMAAPVLQLALAVDAFALAGAEPSPQASFRLVQAGLPFRSMEQAIAGLDLMGASTGLGPSKLQPEIRACANQLYAIARHEAAGLLRREPPDDVTRHVLALVAADVVGRWPLPVTMAEAVRQLGPQATRVELLRLAAANFHRGELAAARAGLAAACARARDPAAMVQLAEARAEQWLVESLALAATVAEPVAGDPEPAAADLSRLRVLQVVDRDAAVALARRLVEAKVPHALPFGVLALDALQAGDRPSMVGHLAAGAKHPGRDATFVTAQVMAEILPTLQRARQAGADDTSIRESLAGVMADCRDHFTGTGATRQELARHLLGVRGWPLRLRMRCDGALAQAVALRAQRPEDPGLQRLVLFEAILEPDHDLARKAVLAPLPAALDPATELHALRASVLLALDLLQDRPAEPAAFDEVLAPLARAPGGAAQAAFLRGVRCWWDGHAPAADAAARAAAARAFDAPPPLGVPRHWQALCAQVTAGGADAPPLAQLFGPARLQAMDDDPVQRLVAMVGAVHTGQAEVEDAAKIEAWAESLGKTAGAATLFAELAHGHDRAGRQAEAAACARKALAIVERDRSDLDLDLPLGRGVVLNGDLGFQVGNAGVRADVVLKVDLRFWIVPPGPDLAEVRRLAQTGR